MLSSGFPLHLEIPLLMSDDDWSLSNPAGLGAYWAENSVFDVAVDNPIGSWSEQKNGYDATQSTSTAKPTLRGTPIRVEFDGTSDYMDANGATALFTGDDTAWTAIFAVDPDDVASQRNFIGLTDTGFARMELRIANGKYDLFKRDDASSFAQVASVASATTGPQIVVFAHSGTTTTIRKNGVTLVDEAAQDVGICTFSTLRIGVRADSLGIGLWSNDMYRIGVYNRRLTDDEIAFVETQWNNDLGLY